ncbi:uncharacterized protein LOC101860293 [Aplysia californica]|uniref:Uncharacterized protein LOC101860293 n=1 Tax=Aplysia californica TaxID=6500 RepID=A0ABM0JAQ4_APLCA|nr:uncharacterized protein LOC101860293 [Aplysia californica]
MSCMRCCNPLHAAELTSGKPGTRGQGDNMNSQHHENPSVEKSGKDTLRKRCTLGTGGAPAVSQLDSADVNENKGPVIHLIESDQEEATVYTFEKDNERSNKTSRSVPRRVPSDESNELHYAQSEEDADPDDVVVFQRGQRDVKVTPKVVTKAVLLTLALIGALYATYWYSINFSKSSEVLSASLLLLLTVLVFKPKYFLPTLIYNNASPSCVSMKMVSGRRR